MGFCFCKMKDDFNTLREPGVCPKGGGIILEKHSDLPGRILNQSNLGQADAINP